MFDSANVHRLVHIDLKGAPPKVSYFEKLIPLLVSHGATGLVLEYEDMFPYHGKVSHLQAKSAYTPADIDKLHNLANQYNIIIIPLIQTFGHFEFVLKHDEHRMLREVDLYPNALCPTHPDSFPLLVTLIEQMLELHQNDSYLHIGADEVWHLGRCPRCQDFLDTQKMSTSDLFLTWILKITRWIKKEYPGLNLIMWDDMIRSIPLEKLKNGRLGDVVEPMIWQYHARKFDLPEGMFDRYAAVFNGLWIASAFKGATGSTQFLPPIQHHINNHMMWLATLAEHKQQFKKLKGIAFTGWQRQINRNVSTLIVEDFINLVRERPAIYDLSNPISRDRDALAALWKGIATEMNWKESYCKVKWYQLRSNFMREKRRITQQSSGSANVKKKWAFYDAMEFIIPYTSARETSTSNVSPLHDEDNNYDIGDAALDANSSTTDITDTPISAHSQQIASNIDVCEEENSITHETASNMDVCEEENSTAYETASNIVVCEEENITTHETASNILCVEANSTAHAVNQSSSTPKELDTNKRRRYELPSEIDDRMVVESERLREQAVCNNEDDLDPDCHFLLSLLPLMKQLSPVDSIDMKIEIYQAFRRKLFKDKRSSNGYWIDQHQHPSHTQSTYTIVSNSEYTYL